MAEQAFLKEKTVWSINTGTPTTAHESPLEPGVWHLPGESTEEAPPEFDEETQICKFIDEEWVVTEIADEPDDQQDYPAPGPKETWNPMMIMRNQRKALLDRTDMFLSIPDFPIDDATREAWKAYRKELRDLPDKYPNPAWGEDGKLTNMQWPRNPDGYTEPDDIFEISPGF